MEALAVTERAIEGPRPGKWSALSPDEASEMATGLLRSKGAVLTDEGQGSISGYLFTRTSPDHWLTAILLSGEDERSAPVERRYPFTITFHADDGGTRMHGDGEGRGLDAVVWVADQIVAEAPGAPPR